jgi:hypothetical protein
MTTKTAACAETIEIAPAVAATAWLIDPERVVLDTNGFAYRRWFVRLPAAFSADGLKEPSLWSPVQRSKKAVRKLDYVTVVAFDETWIAEAWVSHADGEKVVLATPKITRFSERYEALFSDGLYRVEWVGNGYAVRRIADGQHMAGPFATAALAQRALAGLYPRRV